MNHDNFRLKFYYCYYYFFNFTSYKDEKLVSFQQNNEIKKK